jgi:hypothetical protein
MTGIVIPQVNITSRWCNIFGDDINGARRFLGNLKDAKNVRHQWYCPTKAVGRFRMVCAHGHHGQIMDLCMKHYLRYKDCVTFCPRCNGTDDHKCRLYMEHVS